jgi:hypothetical protein
VESSVVGEIFGRIVLMEVNHKVVQIDVEIRKEYVLHEYSSKVYTFYLYDEKKKNMGTQVVEKASK